MIDTKQHTLNAIARWVERGDGALAHVVPHLRTQLPAITRLDSGAPFAAAKA